jgi:hypothetical protein
MTRSQIDHIGSLDSLMAAPPSTELAIGQREARLLAKDLSSRGKKSSALEVEEVARGLGRRID